MLIDWFTVGAQALNFIILVWLLKRFLYKPVLDTIDAREQRIAKELADADAKTADAQKERDEFQRKNTEFDRERAALLGKAKDDAKAERQRLLDEARQAAEALSAKRQETLRNDAHALNQSIRTRTQQEVFAIARKTLRDLAGAELEDRMIEAFAHRLRELNDGVKERFANALKASAKPALVRSAFELPPTQRSAIQNVVNDVFAADIPLRFETASDLVSGVELATDGQSMSWSIAEYLSSLEKTVGELLKAKRTSDSAPDERR
jgi:F-type H+-transporting ATPase subunit b